MVRLTRFWFLWLPLALLGLECFFLKTHPFLQYHLSLTVLQQPSASFFVASLIHVPIGPASIHLIMNGLVGLLLGWAAFPAILVALLLQGVFFQYGGITTLGVNTIIMAFPAVVCYHLYAPLLSKSRKVSLVAAFACGFCAVLFGAFIVGLALMFTEKGFLEVATLVVFAHLPVMIIEGLVTAFTVAFLQKVQPSMLPAFSRSPQRSGSAQS